MTDQSELPELIRRAAATPPAPPRGATPSAPDPSRAGVPEPGGGAAAASTATRGDAVRSRRLPIDDEVLERGRAARRALDDASPEAAADERILHELVAKQLPVALMLHDLEEQLAVRMLAIMDNPQLVLALAKILRDTSVIASSMSKRIQASLSTAASLRAQRRFLALHQHAPESKRDV